jgi:predicted nuclease of predicted toxin-antitoxin system
VKFLVDNQLPTALAQYLRKRGFDCQHVLEAGLGDALDSDICRYAELQERIIISKDEDFFYLAKQREAKLRVIWVRLGIAELRHYWRLSSIPGPISNPA